MTRAYIDIQLLPKPFRRDDEQAVTLRYVAPNVIWKATIRERDVLISL
jgi:hypothetical protein